MCSSYSSRTTSTSSGQRASSPSTGGWKCSAQPPGPLYPVLSSPMGFTELAERQKYSDIVITKAATDHNLSSKLVKFCSVLPRLHLIIPSHYLSFPLLTHSCALCTVPQSYATVAQGNATVPQSYATVAQSNATVAQSNATVPQSNATVPQSYATVAQSNATVPQSY